MDPNIHAEQILRGVLYMSYDGLTDQLGQSQVIPYLNKLAEIGFRIDLISCEKKSRKQDIDGIQKILHQNIHWHFIFYTKRPPVLSSIYDVNKIYILAERIIRDNPGIGIIHCRSYITALAGLRLKRKYGLKFIFDMRGFYADERIDGGLWNTNHFIYKRIYQFFKKQELLFLNESDYTISLTEAGKKEIMKWKVRPDIRIEVIPCCADQDFFSPQRVRDEDLWAYRKKLGIIDSDFIISYLGGMGTWYLPMEMLEFFRLLLRTRPEAKFLIITTDNPLDIRKMSDSVGIPPSKIIITSASRKEVPILLSLSAISIFFIKAVYSKKASCPTKLGETLCMGIPVICNSGVGDVDEIIKSCGSGILIRDFKVDAYEKAIAQIDAMLDLSKQSIRASAIPYFSLDAGVEKYERIYRELSAQI
jgi:glycosyltransferase involved in cell wall biosynthesis